LIINNGYPPDKIVGGMIGNPANCSGFVPINTVAKTVKGLVAKYPTFGGVADWEYFNTLPARSRKVGSHHGQGNRKLASRPKCSQHNSTLSS